MRLVLVSTIALISALATAQDPSDCESIRQITIIQTTTVTVGGDGGSASAAPTSISGLPVDPEPTDLGESSSLGDATSLAISAGTNVSSPTEDIGAPTSIPDPTGTDIPTTDPSPTEDGGSSPSETGIPSDSSPINSFSPSSPNSSGVAPAPQPTGTRSHQHTKTHTNHGQPTHYVSVGRNNKLTFYPEFVKAKEGEIVRFKLYSRNHTVTSCDLETPCQENGIFDSGFKPIPAFAHGRNDNNSFVDFTVSNTSETLFFYSRQGSECHKGMVFAINPISVHEFDMFKRKAMSSMPSAESGTLTETTGSAEATATATATGTAQPTLSTNTETTGAEATGTGTVIPGPVSSSVGVASGERRRRGRRGGTRILLV